jgi:hypothetical protein
LFLASLQLASDERNTDETTLKQEIIKMAHRTTSNGYEFLSHAFTTPTCALSEHTGI